jgi:DNA polymerase-3 subunit gamma/tau
VPVGEPAPAAANLPELWQQILTGLELPSTRMLLSQQATLVRLDGHRAVVRVAGNWMAMVQGRLPLLERAVQAALGSPRQVILEGADGQQTTATPAKAAPSPAPSSMPQAQPQAVAQVNSPAPVSAASSAQASAPAPAPAPPQPLPQLQAQQQRQSQSQSHSQSQSQSQIQSQSQSQQQHPTPQAAAGSSAKTIPAPPSRHRCC